METSREAQAQTGLTFYFLGKTHAGLRKLSAYYRQRGFRVSNLADPGELAAHIAEAPPDIILIDLQSRNDIAEFIQALGAADPGNDTPRVAIISSTTDDDTAAALKESCDESVSWPLKATDLSVKLYNLITRKGSVVGAIPDSADDNPSLYRGEVSPGILKSLLQTLYLSRQDAVLTMESEGRRGNLWFKEGKLIDAQVGALDWEESLDLIRRFAMGSLTITFQSVERRRFIEANALQWLAQREAEEANALSGNEDDLDVAAGLLDAVGSGERDSDIPEILGAPSEEDEEAFEVTTSTSAFSQGDFGLQDFDDDDDDDDERGPGPGVAGINLSPAQRDQRTLPALRALRDEEEELSSAYSDYEDDDDDDYDDDDYDDDDYDDDYDDDDYDDDDYDDTEGTVARVSIQVGRFSREELEERRRMEAIAIEEQPFSGTRIEPIRTLPAEEMPPPVAVEELGMIAAGEADSSDFDDAEYYEQEILPEVTDSRELSGVAALAASAAIGIGASEFADFDDDYDNLNSPPGDAPTLEPRAVPIYDNYQPPQSASSDMTAPPVIPALGTPIMTETIEVGEASEEDLTDSAPIAAAPIAAAAPTPTPRAKAPVAQGAYPPKAPAPRRPVVAQEPYVPEERKRRGAAWIIPTIVILLLGFVVWGIFSGDSTPEGPGPIAGLPNNGVSGEENPNRGLTGAENPNTQPSQTNKGRTERQVIAPSGPSVIPPVERPAVAIDPPKDPAPEDKPDPATNGGSTAAAQRPNTSAAGTDQVAPVATPKPVAASTPKPASSQVDPDTSSAQDSGVQAVASKPPSTPKPAAVEPPPLDPAPPADVDPEEGQAQSAEAIASLLDKAQKAEAKGNLDSAMVLFAQAVDLDPNNQAAAAGLRRVQAATSAPAVKSGELIVNSYPYGLLYIDGEKVGYTPWHRMDAIPRKYVIRVTNPDFGACSVVKEVQPGERTFVHLKLEDDQACGRSSTP